MRRLYENIDNIHIKGGVDQLSELVRAMDVSLQNIADYTDQLVGYLAQYGMTNEGAQYERIVSTSLQLRDEMFDASLELNDMQNQIVEFQNKIYRYEDMPESAQKPNPYLVNRRQVHVNTAFIRFDRADMLALAAVLKNYSEQVSHHIRMIDEKKNSIASVWQDPQYDLFAEFVDGTTKKVTDAIERFEEFVAYLEEKLKELV